MNQDVDYYAILQVDPHADLEVIQAAYRRLAAKYHPDTNPAPQATEMMKALNAAFDVLSHPEKRKTYDLTRAARQSPATGRVPRWLLPVAALVMITTLRISPRLSLMFVFLFLLLWLTFRRQASGK
jgi:curved DNA-binding protein CbpA